MRAMIAALVVLVGVTLPLSGCSDSDPEIPEIEGYTLQTSTSYLMIHGNGSNDVYIARVADDGAAYKWLIINEHVFELNGFNWDHVIPSATSSVWQDFSLSSLVRDEDNGTIYYLQPNYCLGCGEVDDGTKTVVALTTDEVEKCGVDPDSILAVNSEGLSLYYETSDKEITECDDPLMQEQKHFSSP